MKNLHTITWQENKLYVAKALEVEVASQGKTESEALANLKEALQLYFEDQAEVELTPIKQPKLQDLSISI